jgi:hypothetical protein
MARNPYEPPSSPVSESARRGKPPKQVVLAVWLLRASVVIGYASLLLVPDMGAALGDVPAEERSGSMVLFFIVLALTAVVYLWLIQCVKEGRNWARIVMLLLTALGMFSMISSDDATPAMNAISVVDTIIDITAMALLFRLPGSLWFSSRGAAR